MATHPDILSVLNTQILPYVVRIQDMDTPWPAQLWVDDECVHQEGVAMFNVGDLGYLTAEYFAYDNTRVLLDEDPAKVSPGSVGEEQAHYRTHFDEETYGLIKSMIEDAHTFLEICAKVPPPGYDGTHRAQKDGDLAA